MPTAKAQSSNLRTFVWEMLTFDRLLTGRIIYLVYWAGLAIIAILGFGIAGGAIGLMIREFSLVGVALYFPLMIMGLLLTALLGLIWRGMCEFYLAVLHIAEDLRAIRLAQEGAPRSVDEP